MEKENEKDDYNLLHSFSMVEASLHYTISVFGNELARREGYKVHSGLGAVHYYLCVKFGWLPERVRSMSWRDLHFLLIEDMHGWTIPKEAQR